MLGYQSSLIVFLAIGFANCQQLHRRQLPSRQAYPLVETEKEIERPKVYEVQHQISPNQGDGAFQYYSQTSDGLESEQVGHFSNPLNSQVHQGSYTTTDEHGQVVRINYVADIHGPNGAAILPTPPSESIEHVKAREDILRQQRVIRDQHLGYLRAGYAAAGRR